MNTINLIIAIALLACILTPAYVLYFLKYQLFANQKRYKATIDTISNDLSKLHYEVEKIQFDEVENRLERSKQLLELNDKIDLSHKKHSMTQNNVDNINVSLDYLRRTLNSDMSKVNERFELQSALHTAFVAKSEDSFEKSTSLLDNKYELSLQILSRLQNDIDSLQSLNMTTQQILNRINSKEFAQEVLSAWVKDIKQEQVSSSEKIIETPKEVKKKVAKQVENLKGELSSIPLSYYKGRINSFIQHKLANKNKKEIVNKDETITTPIQKEVSKKSPKKDSKRKITMREIETAFKEKTGLTYRGYVLKYGQKEFLKRKGNIYDSVYYQKFTKPKQQNLALIEQMAKKY